MLNELVDLASRAPSAGKAQGWHLVVLRRRGTALFWDITLPAMGRGPFKWQRLLAAPVIALPLADQRAYTDPLLRTRQGGHRPRSRRPGVARSLLDDR